MHRYTLILTYMYLFVDAVCFCKYARWRVVNRRSEGGNKRSQGIISICFHFYTLHNHGWGEYYADVGNI